MININKSDSSLGFGHGGATHKKIFKKAIGFIDDPLHPIFNLKTIKKNLNWPDDYENQFIPGGKFKTAHYYDPEKPVKTLDAWDMVVKHTEKAFKALDDNNFKKFNKRIARSLHYVQDMSVPVHTKTNNILVTHGLYEVFVDKEVKNKGLLKNMVPVEREHKTNSFMGIVKENFLHDASKSRKFYDKVASQDKKEWKQAAQETLPDALSSTFEFLTLVNNHLKKHFSDEKISLIQNK